MTKYQTSKQLTLKIGGQRITADRFLKAVSSFVALINDVSETVTQERSAFRWIVTLESGSAIVHFRPEPYRAQVEFVPLSVRAIDNGSQQQRRDAVTVCDPYHGLLLSLHAPSGNEP